MKDYKDYKGESEETLIEILKQKEISDKNLLITEIILGFISSSILVGGTLLVLYVYLSELEKVIIMVSCFLLFILGMVFCIKIEQIAGYYECKICGNQRIPVYKEVLFGLHIGWTRKMYCSCCNKKTWYKKVIKKKI